MLAEEGLEGVESFEKCRFRVISIHIMEIGVIREQRRRERPDQARLNLDPEKGSSGGVYQEQEGERTRESHREECVISDHLEGGRDNRKTLKERRDSPNTDQDTSTPTQHP